MKKYVFILGLILVSLGTYAQEKTGFKVIGPAEYKEQISPKEDVQLVDVRTPEEFEEGHIEGAENINFHSEDFLEQFKDMDKSRPLYIYCRSGNRSGKAAEQLLAMGFEEVIDLKGGFLSWSEFTKE